MNKIYLLSCIFISLFFLTGCTEQHPNQTSSYVIFKASDPNVKIIQLTAKNFQFEPSIIEVKKGDKVRIIAKSIEGNHGLHLDSNDLAVELPLNEERIIDFVAEKPGVYEFHCSTPCGSGHRGMKGKLIVNE
ncbi:MAG TPA: cupredoxin domain-containing protein [Candidatus Nanoarchaeia archaeon]|nr:cupredoxin domain-containing protein [Candidatus Nanoarchaeia archaeon]